MSISSLLTRSAWSPSSPAAPSLFAALRSAWVVGLACAPAPVGASYFGQRKPGLAKPRSGGKSNPGAGRADEWLRVAETSSRNEVVDSVGVVPKLISHVRHRLGAPALPVVMPSSETRTGCLAFVNNLDRKRDQQVRLTANLTFGIRNLTLETDLGPSFTVPAGETYILKLKQP